MTKKDLPLTLLLVAAFISFLFSVFLWFFVDKDSGVFVGIWVPSILSRCRYPEAMMGLEMWIGGVGIAVFALVFLAGMLMFSSLDIDS